MVKSMNSYISGLMKTLGQNLGYLNDNKFFAGLVMIMLNIGSKYITIDLSKTQEQYLRNGIARQLLIFSISWMGSRDILVFLIPLSLKNLSINILELSSLFSLFLLILLFAHSYVLCKVHKS